MPQINHNNLVWAREHARLSLGDAAAKLQISDSSKTSAEEKLQAYETGTKAPSRAMLSRMTNVYRLPLLSFYLTNPPVLSDRGEDFRTLPDEFEASDDFHVDTLIRDIKASQSTLKQVLIDEEEAVVLDFIGSHSLDDTISSVVETIKATIALDLEEFRKKDSLESAFRYLRTQIEATGVFVVLKGNLGSHHTDISVQAFRGFALSDNVAPFIVLNDKDAKSAWSFSLVHEMAHLVLGRTGISGFHGEQRIEKFCNDVASELFLPEHEFARHVFQADDFVKVCEEVSDYARDRNISASQVAYRLYKRGDISHTAWNDLRTYFRDKWLDSRENLKAKNKKAKGGPDYYVLRRHSLGRGLIQAVERLTLSGALSTTKAGMLLGVRPIKVHKLFSDRASMDRL